MANPDLTAKKQCPKCKSEKYQFHSRKKVPADPAKNEPDAVETKYQCRDCGAAFRVRVSVQ